MDAAGRWRRDTAGAPQLNFDDAAQRLTPLPDRLPLGPATLTPVVLAGPSGVEGRDGAGAVAMRPAAVLVLLYPDEHHRTRVLLTERVVGGRHHSGEVSFPGGKAEPDDTDAAATALREAEEEVGLDPTAIGLRLLGTLDSVWIPVSGFRLTPVLALAERRPVYRPEPREVSRILEPQLARFVPPARIEIVERVFGERRIRFGAYPLDDVLVWGATARVLGQLGEVLRERSTPGTPLDARA